MVLDNAFALHATAAADPPPALGTATVSRARLVRPLVACWDRPVAIVCAPAGYGKTTLLADWATRDERPFTWLGGGAAAQALRAIEGATRPRVIVLDDAHL